LPLWNPRILCGSAHAANPIPAVFYPPTWLLLRVAPDDLPLVLGALHLFLAATGLYLFARVAGCGIAAAAVGGLACQWAGWTAGRFFNFVIVDAATWIPWIFLGAEMTLRGRHRSGAAVLAASTALGLLAGFPQVAVLGLIGAGLYAAAGIVAALARGNVGGATASGGAALAGVLVGALAAAPQLALTLDARADAERDRDSGRDYAKETLRPGGLVALTVPAPFGGPYVKSAIFPPDAGDPDVARHSARHYLAALVVGDRLEGGAVVLAPNVNNASELALYPGVGAAWLAVLGLRRRSARASASLLAVGVAAGLFACGAWTPEEEPIRAVLLAGAPIRATALLTVVLPALFAFAVDAALRPPEGARRRGVGVGGAAVVLATPLAVAAGAVLLAPDRVWHAALELARARGLDVAFGVGPDVPTSQILQALKPALDDVRLQLLRGAGFLAATAFGFAIARRAPRAAWVVIAAATLGDLGGVFLDWVRPVAAGSGLRPETPALAYLRERSGGRRFARVGANVEEAQADVHTLLTPNMGVHHGLNDAQGYRELIPRRTLALFQGLSVLQNGSGLAGFALKDASSPILDLAGVKHLIATRPLENEPDFAAGGLRRAFPPAESRPAGAPLDDVVVYENESVLPPVFVAPRAEVVDDESALAVLRGAAGPFDPRKLALIHAPPAAPLQGDPALTGDAVAELVDSFPGAARCRVDARGPGYLVWTEAWDPSWAAYVRAGDAPPRRIEALRAYGAFVAAPFDVGTTQVTFRYEPRALRKVRLAWIAALGLLLLAAAFVFLRRTRSAAPDDAAAAPAQRVPPTQAPAPTPGSLEARASAPDLR
ncbi:MAG TPA: hypothetical protein VEI02_00655, partial [Planctomycetota bacterium]|nr:hypothetical protein [Planctomycetota bacterium]